MLDVLLWYVWMQAFAFGGWLIASRWLRGLPDRGYGVSKALGLLLGAFAYWILVIFGFSLNNVGAVLLALAVVWGVGLLLLAADDRRQTMDAESAKHGRWMMVVHRPTSPERVEGSIVVICELIFALAFLIGAIYRSYNADIISAGGEKFMESMMINAILRSPTFPPNDAWMSGFSISYYYFGYVIFAMLIRVSGVAPAVGFNLGGAMIFALTVLGAFSIGYNLWKKNSELRIENAERRVSLFSILNSPFTAGVLTTLMLTLMGNMGGLMGALRCGNILPGSFWAWLDLSHAPAEQPVACNGLAPRSFYGSGDSAGWWWAWSRVVHDTLPNGGDQEVITETPIFSFVLGDNHPHVMALPFALIAVALALAYFIDDRSFTRRPFARSASLRVLRAGSTTDERSQIVSRLSSIVLPAIVIGGLSFLNTWDFPIYGTVVIGSLLLGRWLRREPLLPGLRFGIGVMALGYLLYLPFYATFSSQARGIGVNLFNATRLPQFFAIFAPFLVAGGGFLWLMARQVRIPVRKLAWRTATLVALGFIACLVAIAFFGLISPEGRAFAAELNSTGQVMGIPREAVSQRLAARVTDPWTSILLLVGVALCGVLMLSFDRADAPMSRGNSGDTTGGLATSARPTMSCHALDAFALLLFAAGAVLTLSVEFIFLQDLFGTRMNTVFKLYYQAWTLWSAAGAYAVMRLLTSREVAGKVIGAIALAFVAAGLLVAPMMASAKTDNFAARPTLDGAAYLQRSNPDDAKMIAWLNANAKDDPTILEASSTGAYGYEGRISAFTGLPVVLGWGGHQHQWRGSYDEPARRDPLVETIYSSTDPAEAQKLLRDFDVRYVIIGDIERTRYSSEGLAKFEQMCATVFQSGNSTIYYCD
jgi:YYY domain-containing protein